MFSIVRTTGPPPGTGSASGTRPCTGKRALWYARVRRGISLLEVLFAVFILAMGVLGLGALIPVGNYQVSQGLRADHASACARAAFREIETRGLLNWEAWVQGGGNAPTFIANGNQQWPTFMLDPIARVRGVEATYPFGGSPPTMGRLTLPGMEPHDLSSEPDEYRASRARAESIFRWRDDLPGGEDGNRPDYRMGEANDSARLPYHGDYSWMAMITPSLMESTANLPPAQRRTYTVAVIVFNKREVDPLPGSTQDPAVSRPEVVAFNPATQTLTLKQEAHENLEIVPGQWIMLSQRVVNGSGAGAGTMPYHRWYRVVSVGTRRLDATGVTMPLRVQLEGPQWPVAIIDSGADFRATIHQGVVGVYERTIEYDPRAMVTAP